MAIINSLPCVSGGGLTIDLLWINSDPSQQFTSKTVSLDLSEYETFILVCIDNVNTQNRIKNHILTKGYQNVVSHFGFGVNYQHYYRLTTISSGGFTFDNCTLAGTGTRNDAIIPLYIYGVK